MNTSSRGFISLGIVLLIVIGLAVLGGAGYSYSTHVKKENQIAQAYADLHTAGANAEAQGNAALQTLSAEGGQPSASSTIALQASTGSTQTLTDGAHSFEIQVPASWVGLLGNRPEELTGDYVVIKYQQSSGLVGSDTSPAIGIQIDYANFPTAAAFDANLQKSEAVLAKSSTNFKAMSTTVPGASEAVMQTGMNPTGSFTEINAYANGRTYLIAATGFKASDSAMLGTILKSFKILK